jgi:hypothetical protein
MRRLSFWLRLTLLILLFAGLIGLDRLYHTLLNQQPVLEGTPGEVLYAAGFDGFTGEWEQFPGRLSAQINEGVMRIEVGEVLSVPYSDAKPAFTDFDVRVTTTAVAGSEFNDGYGLIFRLTQNANTCHMPHIMLCDLANIDLLRVPLTLLFAEDTPRTTGFYMFLISNDGYYKLWRSDTNGNAEDVTPWMPSQQINLGLNAANTIRVIGRADAFQFFINGERVPFCIPDAGNQPTLGINGECLGGEVRDTWQDATYGEGRIGLVVRTDQTTGTVVEFDNLVVTSPTLDSSRIFPQT